MFGLVIPEIHVNETKEVNKQTHTQRWQRTLQDFLYTFSIYFVIILFS